MFLAKFKKELVRIMLKFYKLCAFSDTKNHISINLFIFIFSCFSLGVQRRLFFSKQTSRSPLILERRPGTVYPNSHDIYELDTL